MPKPSSDWLAEDVAAYRLMGMDKVISLLTPDEVAELSLEVEEMICRIHGMGFQQFAITDRGIPDRSMFTVLANEIAAELVGSASIGIHCRAGIGRSGMLTCTALIVLGMASDEAIDLVSRARGVPVPDTDDQAAFIRSFPVGAGALLRGEAESIVQC